MSKATKPKNTRFNWFEIFRAGKHTDSKGQEQEFTAADLQSVVENFKPKQSPLVIGHPEKDDPAWGWASALKIEGDTLFAQADDVAVEFAEAVENKRYPNRSVRLVKTDNGFALGHIGFLGAKPPALGGMAWQFAASESATEFEFNLDEKIQVLTIDTGHAVVRMFRKIKAFFIERHGAEEADRMMPDWEIDSVATQVAVTGEELWQERLKKQETEFAAKQSETEALVTTLQNQLKEAQQTNQTLSFAAALQDANQFVASLNAGKGPRLLNTTGVAEFMASLDSAETATFEFAAADGAKTQAQAQWFREFLQALPEQVDLTKEYEKPVLADLSATELGKLASDYQQAQEKEGVHISLSTAMNHVKQQQKA